MTACVHRDPGALTCGAPSLSGICDVHALPEHDRAVADAFEAWFTAPGDDAAYYALTLAISERHTARKLLRDAAIRGVTTRANLVPI